MASSHISYFGFGSLVNRQTRPHDEEAVNATLKGWHRVWDHRVAAAESDRRCTSLSIEPAAGDIEGVLVRIPAHELAALDKRESGYERLVMQRSDFLLPKNIDTDTIYIYRSLTKNRHMADDVHPVMQSYIDCVLAGYQTRFGDAGLQRFVSSTRGWENAIFDDRQAPRYPRSVSLPEEQLHSFDRLLAPLR